MGLYRHDAIYSTIPYDLYLLYLGRLPLLNFSRLRTTPARYALKSVVIMAVVAAISVSCITLRPRDSANLCDIYRQNPSWYKASVKAAQRWHGPVYLPMAIMYQESSFRARAKPPMRYFLGFIPYGRPSSAYGYAQALDSTWAQYRREAGGLLSRRDKFAHAVDFVQWYMHKTYQANGVAKTDAKNQYLNYHEGQGGFARGSYKRKPWLVRVANSVEQRASRYAAQYRSCRGELDKRLTRWKLL